MPVVRTRSGTFKSALRTVTFTALLALGVTFAAPLPQPATAATTASNDYCGGQCSDILPPGENGNATLAQILLNQAFGTQPDHADDQLASYADLATGHPSINASGSGRYFPGEYVLTGHKDSVTNAGTIDAGLVA